MSDIISTKLVKTRKPHRCFFCAELYSSGTIMRSTTYKDGKELYREHICNVCGEYIQRYWHYGDECGYGEIKANDIEVWENIKQELNEKRNKIEVL